MGSPPCVSALEKSWEIRGLFVLNHANLAGDLAKDDNRGYNLEI